ncbi:MAG: hypothetical protein IT204_24790 [Fimbriimonadaceae bacterium]|nr:hypothetical protein [Fimbriimonadaceae bacterium]
MSWPLWAQLLAIAACGAAGLTLTRSLFAADATRAQLGLEVSRGDSLLHRTPAVCKLLGLLALAVSAALLPPAGLSVPGALVLLLLVAARLPLRAVAARAAELLPLALIVAVGALLRGDPVLFVATLGRALITVAAVVALTLSTPQPEILRAARRLGLPAPLVEIIALLLRYLVVVLDEANRLALGFSLRAVGPRDLRLARPLGRVIGALAVRSLERGERVHQAMLARGYDGTWPALQRAPAPSVAAWLGCGLFLSPLLAALSYWR